MKIAIAGVLSFRISFILSGVIIGNFTKSNLPKQEPIMIETIVLYSAPGIGHVVAMVELGKLLLRRSNHHFSTITIILTTGLFDNPSLIYYIHNISQLNPSITYLRLPRINPQPISGIAILFDFISRNVPNVETTLREISKTCKIRVCIIDFFATSALPVARQPHIPTYYFFLPKQLFSVYPSIFPYLHNKLIAPTTDVSFRDMTDEFLGIQESLLFPGSHVPEPFLDRFDPAYEEILYFCESLSKSDGIIVNTFDALESNAVKIVADGECNPGGFTPPIYCIGPLIADPHDQGSQKSKHSALCST